MGVVRDFLGRVFSRPDPALLRDAALAAPVQPPAAPVAGARDALAAVRMMRHRDSVRDRQSLGSILSSVSPERLVSIFGDANAGHLGTQIELAEDLEERDSHLASLLQTRRLRVTGLEWVVSPGSDSDGSQEAAELCKAWWEPMDPEAVIYDLLDAVLGQYAIRQVAWETGDRFKGQSYLYPVGTREIDARRLVWPQTDGPGALGPGLGGSPHVPRLMVDWDPSRHEELMPGLHLTHIYRAKRGRPGRMALVRAVAAPWVIKYFALIDFANLVERWGRPFPSVQYMPGMSEAELDALARKLVKSMADGVILTPVGSNVEIETAAANISSLPQESLIKRCEDLQSKVVLGNTTQSDAAADNDSVSSPTHADVGKAIRNADARAIARTIRRDLIVPWFEWNRPLFAGDAEAPVLTPVLSEQEDPEKWARVFRELSEFDTRISSDEFYERVRLTKPADVPQVLTLQRSQPPAGFGFGGGFGDEPRGNEPRGLSPRGRAEAGNDPEGDGEEEDE